MSEPWWHFIKDKESYDTLVSTGMAWELMADLPLTWEEARQKLKELGMEGKLTKEIIVVSAAWCKNCSVLKDALTRAGVIYKVIDADSPEGMDFCRENNVKSLPTSFIYDGGEIVKVVVGNKYQEIKEALE